MTPALVLTTLALIGLGVAGVLTANRWARLLVWILSLPPAGLGLLALWQGGIAEPFSARQLWGFCSLTLWPVLGCVIGTVRHRTRRDFGKTQA